MKQNTIQTAIALALLASSAVHAQQGVQWKVADGGNGHWYQATQLALDCWDQSRILASVKGGYLATITSAQENVFAFEQTSMFLNSNISIGGFKDLPNGEWRWVSGEDWTYSFWQDGEPGCCAPNEWWLDMNSVTGRWRDRVQCIDPSYPYPGAMLVEWSADCNNDGIVDYGQCHDGTLPDYNGNNIPDCCERGEACVVGNYPVQWQSSDGGNGHWYSLVIAEGDIQWSVCQDLAQQSGGYLASLSSAEENQWLHTLAVSHPAAFTPHGPWLGGYVVDGQWRWVSGEPWQFTAWTPTNPNGDGVNMGYWEITNPASESWNDAPESNIMVSFAVEWSADCNNDNIVDYGQILQGQLADANTNGIPDICEGPTCHDIDLNLNGIVDGGDLGILLAFWGTVSPAFPRADINKDGFVNGADLGILLSFWGHCPN